MKIFLNLTPFWYFLNITFDCYIISINLIPPYQAPDGETQPSTEVDLFISTEKIMVLNTDLKEIMMDHALRTISYIADIGDLVVLMARRRFVPHEMEEAPKINRTPKMICHVFESEEAQFIAQSIGQAFQVAYMEFLKANGIEDHSFVKEMDYQEVLNSQEIFGDELQMFAKKEMQKEVNLIFSHEISTSIFLCDWDF